MLNFCDFIQVYVFTTIHHLKEEEKLCQKNPQKASLSVAL